MRIFFLGKTRVGCVFKKKNPKAAGKKQGDHLIGSLIALHLVASSFFEQTTMATRPRARWFLICKLWGKIKSILACKYRAGLATLVEVGLPLFFLLIIFVFRNFVKTVELEEEGHVHPVGLDFFDVPGLADKTFVLVKGSAAVEKDLDELRIQLTKAQAEKLGGSSSGPEIIAAAGVDAEEAVSSRDSITMPQFLQDLGDNVTAVVVIEEYSADGLNFTIRTRHGEVMPIDESVTGKVYSCELNQSGTSYKYCPALKYHSSGLVHIQKVLQDVWLDVSSKRSLSSEIAVSRSLWPLRHMLSIALQYA